MFSGKLTLNCSVCGIKKLLPRGKNYFFSIQFWHRKTWQRGFGWVHPNGYGFSVSALRPYPCLRTRGDHPLGHQQCIVLLPVLWWAWHSHEVLPCSKKKVFAYSQFFSPELPWPAHHWSAAHNSVLPPITLFTEVRPQA